MPSTYSPSLRIELIGAGEQSGTWGTTTNTNLGTLLEQSIAGVQAITMFDANYTLTNYNGVSDEARKAVLVVGGTNGAIRNIIAPLVTKTYTIKNNTVGGFAILIKAATGASVSIPNGGTSTVYCDGTDFQLALTQTIVAAGTAIAVATVGATTTVTNTGVASFNTRTGAVTQTSADVTTALGYTPPTPTGTGASGTWGINVTGNAATSTNSTTAASCSGNAATATNPQSGGSFITSSNIGSQSVSFASSATNAVTATNATNATNATTAATCSDEIGVGQTWQVFTYNSSGAQRNLGQTYTNSTGRPIMVSYSTNQYVTVIVNGITIMYSSGYNTAAPVYCFIVPAGNTYSISSAYVAGYVWAELR